MLGLSCACAKDAQILERLNSKAIVSRYVIFSSLYVVFDFSTGLNSGEPSYRLRTILLFLFILPNVHGDIVLLIGASCAAATRDIRF